MIAANQILTAVTVSFKRTQRFSYLDDVLVGLGTSKVADESSSLTL